MSPKIHPLTILLAFATVWSLSAVALAQDATKLKSLQEEARQALLQRNPNDIQQVVVQIRAALGDRAGIPEVPDEPRPVPKLSAAWTKAETTSALKEVRQYITRQKWWRTDLDPTQCNHALREVAVIIEACVDASKLDEQSKQTWLDIANEASDFLLHAQSEAKMGLYPFPAMRNGKGRPFEVAEAFMRRAEKNGQLNKIINNGWLVNDLGDGGLQFDNGEAGVAVLHLYETTRRPELLESVRRSSDWACEQPIVLNWNYNSFTVHLLAESYRVTREACYLEEAKARTLVGLLPGQLPDGPRAGRWLDPHNARPAYHYIMIRGLISLFEVLPDNDPDRSTVANAIRLAFRARNPDFAKGIINADSAMETLLQAKRLPVALAKEIGDCDIDSALSNLETYGIERWRAEKPAFGPGAWCDWLLFREQASSKE